LLTRATPCVLVAALAASAPCFGWGAPGHRIISYLALYGLPAEAPAWLKDLETWHRVAYQSNEPDRWRGWQSTCLAHVNRPEHYLDIELLDQFGLTLESMPKLRGEYLRAMAVAKHVHPERVDRYDAARDPDRSKEWPGLVAHAMAEHYALLQASFNTVRVLEQLNEPARAQQLAQARANTVYHMGVLSHFVGDAAQPLHTTKHFNGWVGANPGGYTTERGFHSYIDSGVLETHGLTYEALRPLARFERRIAAPDAWDDILAHLRRAFDQVEPLYRLQRDGLLDGPDGKALITARLLDGAEMLSALYWSAYTSAAPTGDQLSAFLRYNDFDPQRFPERTASPPPAASAPATSAPAASPPAASAPAPSP